MSTAFFDAFLYELKSIRNSWYKLFLITLLPILSFVLIIAIFKIGVVRDLPVAVVDQDRSLLSRMVLRNIDASPTIKILSMPNNTKEAMDLVKETKAYGVIVIPPAFCQRYPAAKKSPHHSHTEHPVHPHRKDPHFSTQQYHHDLFGAGGVCQKSCRNTKSRNCH